ncbi:MAG: hypothetical protein KAJ10_15225 [Thermodesulfovibrionia bacterium]|nr:hypothetical protein [Thermodesulfovibrionia bacterium]
MKEVQTIISKRSDKTNKTLKEVTKMKKKTITTIMSIITILFIFTSVSHAISYATATTQYPTMSSQYQYQASSSYCARYWWRASCRLPDLRIYYIRACKYLSGGDAHWNILTYIKNYGGNRGLVEGNVMPISLHVEFDPSMPWSYESEDEITTFGEHCGTNPDQPNQCDDDREGWMAVPRAGQIRQFVFNRSYIDDEASLGHRRVPKKIEVTADPFRQGLNVWYDWIEESNDYNNKSEVSIYNYSSSGQQQCWYAN